MVTMLPTKGNLILAKRSRELASKGFDLMDKKRNILIHELMTLIDKARDIQARADTVFAEAYDSLKYASISLGGLDVVTGAIAVDNSLNLRYHSVMGVEIPTVISAKVVTSRLPYGTADTSEALDTAYKKFNLAKGLIRDLAETENAIYRLAYSIKKAQKRANALENIVIPNLDKNITSITDSLEEKDREEFVRLKVIKAKK